MLRRHTIQVLLLLIAPLTALAITTYLAWTPSAGGRTLTAALASLGGAAAVAALVFAVDAVRIRRAFGHLRAGGAALGGWVPPEKQRVREQRHHETVVRLRRQVEQLSAIRDLALIANDDVCFERILERSLVVLGGLLAAREITIYLQEEDQLVAVARRLGEKIRVRKRRPLSASPDVALQALQARQTVVQGERGKQGLRAGTLLVADGEVVGALEVRLSRQPDGRDALELARELEGLAKHIALAIRKPTLYDRAVVDGLTKLYTKRHFLEQARHHMAQGIRLGTPLSLIIADVDHFKRINDEHGHVAGDIVLAEVARRLQAGIRGYDQAFRYGGEEVIVLAPNTRIEDAVGLAERLRRKLSTKPMETGDESLEVRASFGVAEFDAQTMEDVDAFVAAADRHLYRAKHSGRDRVESDLTESALPEGDEAEVAAAA